jgi:hypothetical protein
MDAPVAEGILPDLRSAIFLRMVRTSEELGAGVSGESIARSWFSARASSWSTFTPAAVTMEVRSVSDETESPSSTRRWERARRPPDDGGEGWGRRGEFFYPIFPGKLSSGSGLDPLALFGRERRGNRDAGV